MPEQVSKRKSIGVYIKLDGEGFASAPEFDLRYELKDMIAARDIWNFEGAGSGGGWMDVSFGVDSIDAVDPAITAVKKFLGEYNVPDDDVRLDVMSQYDQICDEPPDFQPGDCLYYRFEDGNFGAAVVLSLGAEDRGWGDEMLLGLLDYKAPDAPSPEDFEQRNWLIGTHDSWKGVPYLIWLHCFGGLEVEVLHRVALIDDDPMQSSFHLSWELVPEYVIREKYRENKALNPYDVPSEEKYFPDFKAGDCLSYRLTEDSDFGAALVLKRSDERPNGNDTLLVILDYVSELPPSQEVFRQNNWLISQQAWRKGQPYLVWAKFNWTLDYEDFDVEVVGHIALNENMPIFCQLGLFWEDIPEFVLFEKGMLDR
jgi:hypothetical protein